MDECLVSNTDSWLPQLNYIICNQHESRWVSASYIPLTYRPHMLTYIALNANAATTPSHPSTPPSPVEIPYLPTSPPIPPPTHPTALYIPPLRPRPPLTRRISLFLGCTHRLTIITNIINIIMAVPFPYRLLPVLLRSTPLQPTLYPAITGPATATTTLMVTDTCRAPHRPRWRFNTSRWSTPLQPRGHGPLRVNASARGRSPIRTERAVRRGRLAGVRLVGGVRSSVGRRSRNVIDV